MNHGHDTHAESAWRRLLGQCIYCRCLGADPKRGTCDRCHEQAKSVLDHLGVAL